MTVSDEGCADVFELVDDFSPRKYKRYSLPLPVVIGTNPAPFLGLGPGVNGFVGKGRVVHSCFEVVRPTSPSPLASVYVSFVMRR